MRSIAWVGLALGLTIFGARTASATDYWDASFTNDNDFSTTYNELHHGVSQQHDLQANPGPVADQDWSFVVTGPNSSYEAIVDSASGDVFPLELTRLDNTGTTVIQQSERENVSPFGTNRALRWTGSGFLYLNYLRVQSGGCAITCSSAAQYSIRLYETTIAVPRFNNAAGQITVLIVQNLRAWNRPVSGVIHFWAPSGGSVGSTVLSLTPGQALVLNTSTVPGVAGQGGTITIEHDGGYGGLAVKAVALEPSTGFSFDSPGLYKPH